VFAGIAVQCRPSRFAHYYAGPGNQFWRLLHESGLVPDRLGPADDHLLPSFGFGLTDLLRDPDTDEYLIGEFHDKIARCRPDVVAFTSKAAASSYARALGERMPRGYGEAPWDVAGSAAFVLPGPSGANNGMPLPVRTALWRDLADHLVALSDGDASLRTPDRPNLRSARRSRAVRYTRR
jgi:TDG/mug DNA glycosylase family protein